MFFSPASFWNQRLPASARVDPDSATFVGKLTGQGKAATYGFSYQTFSVSIFFATPTTPTVSVRIDQPEAEAGTSPYWKDLETIMAAVPIPPQCRPPGPFPGDNHVVIVRRNLDGTADMWELWKFSKFEVDGPHSGGQATGCSAGWLEKAGFHCEAGAGYEDVAKSVGFFDDTSWPGIEGSRHFSASASGLPFLGGAILPAEVQRGYIPHALALAVPKAGNAKAPTFRWPASKADGASEEAEAIQQGMCFRLPAAYDLSKIADSAIRTVCTAIRDFGMYVNDSAGNVSIKCANEYTVPGSQATTNDPWKGPENKFGGKEAIWSKFPSGAGGLAEQIPWADLQVVDASYRPSAIAAGNLPPRV
jgi:hypothetical protein